MTLRLLERVIAIISRMVPRDDRCRWREEWLGELEHVARTRGSATALRLAAGALPDAFACKRVMNTGVSWLDLKLGVRMVIKYPGLALVGVAGMSVAIAIGAGCFAFFYSYMNPPLPLDEGDRIVAIENWDAAARNRENRTLHDFVTWRDELKSIDDVGAYREVARNLITADGVSERVRIAEMTASGFQLARVAPMLGRPLVTDDERRGATPVLVIGYDAWQKHFASDPAVIGKTVGLGNTIHTIVGLMPDGFAFPVYHDFWVPLQTDPSAYERRRGPAINVFGRLAPGVSRDTAQAELTTIGLRAAADFPETNEHMRPRVAAYTSLWFGDDMVGWQLDLMQVLITMLLVVVCVNVASLVYARTASRHGEIAIRSALGGSRRRIVAQLFVEALVLSAAAAAVGLAIADRALRYVNGFLDQMGGAPFWMGDGLSFGSVIYVGGLAILAAAIVGAIPAVKATGRRLEPGLRQLGGATGLQLGRTWTALIVSQVALAVAVMPAAFSMGWEAIDYRTFDAGFAADEFLTAQLSMDRDVPPTADAAAYQRAFASRFGDRVAEVLRQLESESGVIDVTFGARLPGDEEPARVEVEGVNDATAVRSSSVAVDFFDAFDTPILAGRPFGAADLDAAARPLDARTVPTISSKLQDIGDPTDVEIRLVGARSTAVIVNRSFAQEVLGGGNVLGRRVRYAGANRAIEGWYEIVGVIPDFPGTAATEPGAAAKIFHPITPAHIYPAKIAVRVRGASPASLAGRLRQITSAIDPTLQLAAVIPLDRVYREGQTMVKMSALAFGLVTLSVLLLSAAGIYALMSFTVAQRRREIGIRAALGADPRRILAGIFARALRQLAIGVVVGLGLAALLFEEITNNAVTSAQGAILLSAVALIMTAVGLLAAIGPARRGLRIDPTESLRTDG
jgi:putative ABC transport system permease protein